MSRSLSMISEVFLGHLEVVEKELRYLRGQYRAASKLAYEQPEKYSKQQVRDAERYVRQMDKVFDRVQRLAALVEVDDRENTGP